MYEACLLECPREEHDVAGLSRFHGKRFVVLLTNGSWHVALQGIARYVKDAMGSELRIEADNGSQVEREDPVFVVREDTWDGCFVPDNEYGCEFQLHLDVDLVRNQA